MNKSMMKIMLFFFAVRVLTACGEQKEIDHKFTIAVIPDTQNYLDFRHQPEEGFMVDAGGMFLTQMEFIAANAATNGGEIEFATSVGDVWDHVDMGIDPEHAARGLKPLGRLANRDSTRIITGRDNVEIPLAIMGYEMLSRAGLKFSVVPGNHDFDWTWFDSNFPLDLERRDEIRDADGWYSVLDPEILGMLHYGGYNTFNSVFGADASFFNGRDWYVDSYKGGANSAQVFEAGGYKFLHLGFEMQAGQAVLDWAQTVIDRYSGLPTIITTHDYLNQYGERKAEMNMDLARIDPMEHVSAEVIFDSFVAKNDQVFMVLCGHFRGAVMRTDQNEDGNNVYQILSNYQGRGQVENPEPGRRPGGVGDGWMRLMEFDTSLDVPTIRVRTYSTHYKKFSSEMPEYAAWYKPWENADLTDEEFLARDDFVIELEDFRERFDEE